MSNKTADTFELQTEAGVNINSVGMSYYGYGYEGVIGGFFRKYVTQITGLGHLDGESVSILADGAVLSDQNVSELSFGAITLPSRATTVHIGLGYNSDGQQLRLEAGSADGTALGKTRRIHRVAFLLHRSLGLSIGTSFDDLDTLVFRTTSDVYSRAVPLYSGILSQEIEADYDFENQICFRQDQPLPSTILAIMPQMVTEDRG